MDARTSSEARRRSLLRDLERALYDALADSPEVHRSLWRLQRAGFTLRLTIDCGDGAADAQAPPPAPASAEREARFTIDGEDLRFLRSIGIDPTRSRRARKRR